jgi:hypothetical protein
MDDVNQFQPEDKLSHVKVLEPMTGNEMAKTEITRTETLTRLTSFDKSTLKATLTEEKIILPDSDIIFRVRMVFNVLVLKKLFFRRILTIDKCAQI